MATRISVEANINLPSLRRKISIEKAMDTVEKDWKRRYFENTQGRLLKSTRVQNALRIDREIRESGIIRVGELRGRFQGSKEELGIAIQNELGTKGYGGPLKSITPKNSLVLTIPDTRGGVSRHAKARQFPNAVWVPWRGREDQPMLVELEPPKRSVGPNHKKPRRFMSPSRKITRVIMHGVKKVDIRPKHFLQESFEWAVERFRSTWR